MCLRCAKAAYSSRISIQLQRKGSAEPPLIGRATREGILCARARARVCRQGERARVHKVVVAAGGGHKKKKLHALKYYNSLKLTRKTFMTRRGKRKEVRAIDLFLNARNHQP